MVLRFHIWNCLSDTNIVKLYLSRKESAMLSFEEFIELWENASEELKVSVEEFSAKTQSQSESLEQNSDNSHTF